jgi:D-alanine-D-alanine ligase
VTPGALDAGLEAELAALAIRAYDALACRDFARADFKCDEIGRPCFLEINPLPTFAPDGSFGILAELEGRPVEALVADVLASGLRRLGLA